MRPSKFNIIIPYPAKNAFILYNSYSGAIIKIEREKISLINKVLNGGNKAKEAVNTDETRTDKIETDKAETDEGEKDEAEKDETRENLKKYFFEKGILVADDHDELEEIIISRRAMQYGNKRLCLTLVPTINCNFACPYCFVTNKNKSPEMSEKVQAAIINLVKSNIKKYSICGVTWFGGEPLLGLKLIEKLSKELIDICTQNQVQYDSDIITNGYLISEESISKLITCQIKRIQITLDGPADIHDRRRYLATSNNNNNNNNNSNNDSNSHNNRKVGTYQKIISNIVTLIKYAEHFRSISIRINLDKLNYHRVDELISELKSIDPCNKLEIYPAKIKGNAPNESSCFSSSEFAELNAKLNPRSLSLLEPSSRPNGYIHCMAESTSNFCISNDGDIYKCYEDLGNQKLVVGNILDNDFFNGIGKRNRSYSCKYLSYDPRDFKKCRECNILPLCMGGCAKDRIDNNGEPVCIEYKYSLSSQLIKYVKQKLTSVQK